MRRPNRPAAPIAAALRKHGRSAPSPARPAGSCTRPGRPPYHPRSPTAALSTPTCTPARNSSRSAGTIATHMTASYQTGALRRSEADIRNALRRRRPPRSRRYAMSSGARRGLPYQAIGEKEIQGWAKRKS